MVWLRQLAIYQEGSLRFTPASADKRRSCDHDYMRLALYMGLKISLRKPGPFAGAVNSHT